MRRERQLVPRREQAPRPPDDLRQGPRPGGQHRGAGGHRLQDGQAEPLAGAGQHHHAGGAVDGGQVRVVDEARQMEPIGHPIILAIDRKLSSSGPEPASTSRGATDAGSDATARTSVGRSFRA